MDLLDAIKTRHSVRRYKIAPLTPDVKEILVAKINEVNSKGNLHVQLITDEPKAFSGIMAYGTFSGVTNYFVMAGRNAKDLDERVGYFGEQLVLLAQQLGLNTCWAGLSYRKVPNTYQLEKDEKICCYIALGYGDKEGPVHKKKSAEEISNISQLTPQWFNDGVEAARLAPTAVNQQKFYFEYTGISNKVIAKRLFSMVGYTRMDMGIAKLHFEIGANREIEWIDK